MARVRLGRVLLVVAASVAVVTVLSGCQVNTQVAIHEVAGGRGVVAVTVTLDAGALAALGGRPALAAQLQDADLVASGWTVAGPLAGPGSTTIISASHPFATPAQASVLVGDLAGTGPGASRPFRVSLSEHRSFWRTDTNLSGTVDLTCGLACFGDSGLTSTFGSPLGVDPGPLVSSAHQNPDQVFTFSVLARLGGSLVSTNAASHQGGTLEWTPRLGQVSQLSALTRSWNEGRIKAVAIAGGSLALALLVLLGVILYRWRRRGRRRRSPGSVRNAGETKSAGRSRGGLHRKEPGSVADPVAPHS